MKIIIAKNAGYCFGVKDAVNLAHDIAKKEGKVYMLGDIVHNEKVVDDLSNAGAKVVESLKDVPENGTMVGNPARNINKDQKIDKNFRPYGVDIKSNIQDKL